MVERVSTAAKRVVAKVLSAVSLIAGVVFFFMPLSTGTQAILCIAAFFVFIICAAVGGNLDHENTGYWPDEPEN